MKSPVSRRICMKSICVGAVSAIAQSIPDSAKAKTPELAIDRSGVEWCDRPMYLRAYHPPYLIYYYGAMHDKIITEEHRIVKWGPLVNRLENEPDIKIRIIEAFDDACANCAQLTPDPLGSVWGVGYTCHSAEDPDIDAMVIRTNKRIEVYSFFL